MRLGERIHYAIQDALSRTEQHLGEVQTRRAIRFSIQKNARLRGLTVREARRRDAEQNEDIDWRSRMPGDQSVKG